MIPIRSIGIGYPSFYYLFIGSSDDGTTHHRKRAHKTSSNTGHAQRDENNSRTSENEVRDENLEKGEIAMSELTTYHSVSTVAILVLSAIPRLPDLFSLFD
ncbi:MULTISPECIES: hypothetical protein [Acidithrix]|uniref:hypothetical protein n=1 Tax=Acidithrix TaxID=1609233 RepID=UPI0006974A03|nr:MULTISPECIES: hypothetical protein [Acidithrix]CAG4905219.1 unnamed protein product [Acidithrix sp. C25]